MTLLGWLFLIVSWGVIIGLCVFCFVRLTNPEKEKLHSPLDIEAEIEEEENSGHPLHPGQSNNKHK